jgi:hypothetical protein
MAATPFLPCVFGKNDVFACDAFHRLALFHVARFNYPCQTVSDAGRILLLRVLSRNPRWCEAGVPKLSEHQATPAEYN